jgi:hypothetical protein
MNSEVQRMFRERNPEIVVHLLRSGGRRNASPADLLPQYAADHTRFPRSAMKASES